jgi:glycosyltransferase involved in cell wall biosynthesis
VSQSRAAAARRLLVDLSIIIPTFNRLWSLPKAIESCRSTACPHEIIVVDDGSSDGTAEWLAQQADQQSDLVVIRTENWGKDWAVNTGFARARGEYIRFLDSDDWIEAGANDAQIAIARQNHADLVLGNYRTFDDRTGTSTPAELAPTDDFIAQQLGEGEYSHYSAFLFRRAFIQDIPHRPEFLAVDDRMFVLEVALRHPKLASYEGIALVHRHHDRGRLQAPTTMQAEIPIVRAEHAIYRKVMDRLQSQDEFTERRKRALAGLLWPLAHRIARHDLEEAIDIVRHIYRLDPSFQIPGRGLVPTLYRKLGFRTVSLLLRARRQIVWPLEGMRRG